MTRPPPRTITFSVEGPIALGDLALCDVRGVEPDAVTVEALARLQLAARRHGCRVRLLHASRELLDLVAFMGLRDVLPG